MINATHSQFMNSFLGPLMWVDDLLSYPSNESNDDALKRVFLTSDLSKRTLQSAAIHLRMSIDVHLKEVEELKRYVGGYFRKYYPSVGLMNSPNNTWETELLIHGLKKMRGNEVIPDVNFNILVNFDRRIIVDKLLKFQVFGDLPVGLIFGRGYDQKLTLRYLCDICQIDVNSLVSKFRDIENDIEMMRKWHKRLKWFSDEEGRRDAAYTFFSKDKTYEHPVKSMDDLVVFFYTHGSEEGKELIFTKIRSIYHNRNSRNTQKKRQCNFALDAKTEKIIDRISEFNRVPKSIVLDAIFHPENQMVLQDLFRRGFQNLLLETEKRANDLLKSPFKIRRKKSSALDNPATMPVDVTPAQSTSFASGYGEQILASARKVMDAMNPQPPGTRTSSGSDSNIGPSTPLQNPPQS